MRRRIALVLLLLVAAGFAVRAVPVKTGAHYWDETVYLQHGEIIAGERANNYDEFDFRPPIISLLLGALFTVFHSIVAAHLLIAFIAALGIPLTYLVGRRLFNTRVGLIAAAVYAASPIHIKYAHDILVDSMLPVVWLATTYLLLRSLERDDRLVDLGTGILIATAVLTKFTSLVLVPAAGLILLLDHVRDLGLRRGIRRTFVAPRTWTVAAGFVLAMAPYLVWNQLTYGSPVHTFIRGMMLSGATDPFMTYIKGFTQVVLPPFLLGIVLFPFAARTRRWPAAITVILAAALLLPLQLWLGNKELRFLLPVLPFLGIMAGAGFELVRDRGWTVYAAVMAIILVSSGGMVFQVHDASMLRSGHLTTHSTPPVYEAGTWLRANATEDTVLYANYQWPVLAYYSGLETVLLPFSGGAAAINRTIDRPGYVYYDVHAPDDRPPSLTFLRQDPRFALNRTFGDEEAYIFYYEGG